MMEFFVKALMSAVDEVAWEQTSLFNESGNHLTVQPPSLEPFYELTMKTLESFPSSSMGIIFGVRLILEFFGHATAGCTVSNDASKLRGGGVTFPVGWKNFPKRQFHKKLWFPNQA